MCGEIEVDDVKLAVGVLGHIVGLDVVVVPAEYMHGFDDLLINYIPVLLLAKSHWVHQVIFPVEILEKYERNMWCIFSIFL